MRLKQQCSDEDVAGGQLAERVPSGLHSLPFVLCFGHNFPVHSVLLKLL